MNNTIPTRTSKFKYAFDSAINNIEDSTLKQIIISILNSYIEIYGTIYNFRKERRESLLYFLDEIKNLNIENINWLMLCKLVDKNYKVSRFCAMLLHYMLTNNIYNSIYSDKLYDLRDLFDVNYWSKLSNDQVFSKHFIGDDIKYYHYTTDIVDGFRSSYYYIIKVDNENLWQILKDFCDRETSTTGNPIYLKLFFLRIGSSFGTYENNINSISDFNYDIFIYQTNYFKKFDDCKKMLLTLNRLYIFLIEHKSGKGKNIFKPHDNIELDILKRDDFAQKTIDGFEFYYYNPQAPIPNNDKWILHINGFEDTTTKATPSTTIAYDFTKIEYSLFRNVVKKIIWTATNLNFRYKYDYYNKITKLLNYIYQLKSQNDYPNPKLDYFNIFEATLIRKHIENMPNGRSTKSSSLYAIRDFLELLQSDYKVEFEIMFFDYLNNFKGKSENTAHAVPDDDLEKINAIMIKNCHLSYFNTLCYVIFHLCIQTEFRISQICNLKVHCIEDTMKNNQFMIKTIGKTSNSQVYEAIISDLTKKHLDDIISKSHNIREQCSNADLKDYIFVYKSQQNRYKLMEYTNFNEYLRTCCIEANTPIYTASNLRDTHMTKAEEYRMRHNYSDVELSILTQHKYVDTTRNHYIESNLISMLESTYGIIIGDVTIDGEIVEKIIDENIMNKEHSVEDGCGYCKKDTCSVLTNLTCLKCKYFITTIKHEKHFKDYIIQIDNMILKAPTPHDKDDLINIKRLYTAYLLKILELKGCD